MQTVPCLVATLLAVAPAVAPAIDDDAAMRRRIERDLDALASGPEDARRLGDEARLLHYLAELTDGDEARAAIRARGLQVAERALALDPGDPQAILWWTAHRGSQATPLHPVQAIRIAAEVEEALLRLRRIAPDYDHAAADRVLAVVYRVAPPVLSIGSLTKSERHIRQALARDPAYPGNLLVLVQLLAKQGRCVDARRGAAVVLGSPLLSRYPLEARGWTRDARAIIEGPCP